MQTFLPFPGFQRSARCLDDRRLGKQRVEALQVLNALLDPAKRGWKNHPCTRMWRGHEDTLVCYGLAVCDEWRARGHRDTVREKLLARLDGLPPRGVPPWLGDPRLHSSHRASLLRKDPEHYGRLGWRDDPALPLFWPV